jgi:hypothetical protein
VHRGELFGARRKGQLGCACYSPSTVDMTCVCGEDLPRTLVVKILGRMMMMIHHHQDIGTDPTPTPFIHLQFSGSFTFNSTSSCTSGTAPGSLQKIMRRVVRRNVGVSKKCLCFQEVVCVSLFYVIDTGSIGPRAQILGGRRWGLPIYPPLLLRR